MPIPQLRSRVLVKVLMLDVLDVALGQLSGC